MRLGARRNLRCEMPRRTAAQTAAIHIAYGSGKMRHVVVACAHRFPSTSVIFHCSVSRLASGRYQDARRWQRSHVADYRPRFPKSLAGTNWRRAASPRSCRKPLCRCRFERAGMYRVTCRQRYMNRRMIANWEHGIGGLLRSIHSRSRSRHRLAPSHSHRRRAEDHLRGTNSSRGDSSRSTRHDEFRATGMRTSSDRRKQSVSVSVGSGKTGLNFPGLTTTPLAFHLGRELDRRSDHSAGMPAHLRDHGGEIYVEVGLIQRQDFKGLPRRPKDSISRLSMLPSRLGQKCPGISMISNLR